MEKGDCDRFCEKSYAVCYHARLGRPSLAPGLYFRIMLIGFFEGIDSERGIATRLADLLTLRQFLSIGLDEQTPDHVTVSERGGSSALSPINESSPGCWNGWCRAGRTYIAEPERGPA